MFLAQLRDVHALERLVDSGLGALVSATAVPELRGPLQAHRAVTREHLAALEARLAAHGAAPSAARDTGLALAALGESLLARVRGGHPAGNARDAYVLAHLAVPGYELLGALAGRAGDEETARLARRYAADERSAAAVLDGLWDRLLELSLGRATAPSVPPAGVPHTLGDQAGDG
ncbi:hypothetical protein SCATT_55670 [Streptantibioticus cattleyicolor NRRL 8057 = DSM 46488]|uniref:DUF892 family protein n=1 Tax=Streptantibioticus cattleyicolor (strain ATCC 35852 / DSM 46488 / JCM 4925 / NBRC 14057 / NRRL 8057) TaxID=1003195 RepID=G8X170_STREN|nr:hypothetical protein SCATT_55670 [Streptantibioticus cattleyicolor NRRL 8057 = DSM 46488]